MRQCSPTWANTDGIEAARWGSLDSSGRPLAVRDPTTTQELDPVSPSIPRGAQQRSERGVHPADLGQRTARAGRLGQRLEIR